MFYSHKANGVYIYINIYIQDIEKELKCNQGGDFKNISYAATQIIKKYF